MSKFIDEILKDIKQSPQTWVRFGDYGIAKGDTIIENCGNGSKWFFFWLTSVVEVKINGKNTWHILTLRDKYRVEEAFKWWMRNVSKENLSK